MNKFRGALLIVPLGFVLAGCQSMNNTGSGALLGTGVGATAGALIGHATGNTGAGALIGAASGATAGALIGNAKDAREERDAAVAHAQYAQAQSHAVAQALKVSDVVTMSQSGVSDNVIANALHTRGCLFDGSPDTIIYLRRQGVSDHTISAMQSYALRADAPVAVMPPGPLPPTVVYGAPPPPPVVVYGGYYGRPYYGRYRRW